MSNNTLNSYLNKKENNSKTYSKNYIDNANIINEKSSDNDNENSDKEIEAFPKPSIINSNEKEIRRFVLEYIKVIGIYEKGNKGQEINIKDIMEEYEIPKEMIEEKKEEIDSNINNENSEMFSNNENEDNNDFDNDVQPIPSLNHEMKMIIYLSKPKIIGFDGKLGLFYISPTPFGKEDGYNIIIKNPENMKIIYKIKIMEIITCVRKSEKIIYLTNFGTKILSKTNHEMTFKKGEDCSLVYQGIIYLMNNKEDDIFY